MTMTEYKESSKGSGLQLVGRVFRFLVRLLFVLVIGTLIGLGLFYGVPWVYRRLVWPIQENSARITVLEEQVAKNSESIFDNHRAREERIETLETETADMQERADAEARDQETLSQESEQLGRRVTSLEDDVEAQRQAIEQARSDFTAATSGLEQQLEGVEERLEEVQGELGQQIQASAEDLGELEGELDEALVHLSLLQTAQDLLKVRLHLTEENFGTAREALALAVVHLDRATAQSPSDAEVLDDLRTRMLAADDLIAERSFRAGPTLEALWADVANLAVPLAARSGITETQTASPSPTPTPSQ